MRTPDNQPSWMRDVQVGSVIAERNGPWRVVRHVTRSPNGTLWGVSLTIRHCSWTGRAYTVITASDLKTRGFRLLPVKPVKLKGEINERIARAITQPAREPFAITCCEVRGIA
jgi:hypothetical protein